MQCIPTVSQETKVRTKIRQRKRPGLQVRRSRFERAPPCKRLGHWLNHLCSLELTFLISNGHCTACSSAVLAMIKWREINEIILHAATFHAHWPTTEQLYHSQLCIQKHKEHLSSTYYIPRIWNTKINKVWPLLSGRGDTHKAFN